MGFMELCERPTQPRFPTIIQYIPVDSILYSILYKVYDARCLTISSKVIALVEGGKLVVTTAYPAITGDQPCAKLRFKYA